MVSWCCKTQIWYQHAPLPFSLPSVRRKKLTIDFAGGNQSSNGGLLLREAERKHCRRLAETMPDRRDPDRVRHATFEMVMSRVSAIACGHEDAMDLNPLTTLAVGRCPECGQPLASRSTVSRLENAPSKTEAALLAAALLDQFGTTVKPGKLEILDIDDTFCAALPRQLVVRRQFTGIRELGLYLTRTALAFLPLPPSSRLHHPPSMPRRPSASDDPAPPRILNTCETRFSFTNIKY
jgi:hypothetical protein